MNARQLLLNLVIVVVLLAIGGGIAYESYETNNYVSTDNAQVQVPLVDVAALAPGTVQSVPLTVGTKVQKGTTLAVVAPATTGAASTGTTAANTAATGRSATKRGAAKAGKTVATTGTAATPGVLDVTAPVGGVVSAVSVTPGQTVLPGQTLAEVAEPTEAVIVANVPETSIRDIEDGQAVDVTLDAYPGTTFKGHVRAVQPATQASLSLFPASSLSGSFTKVTELVPVYIAFNSEGDVLYNGLSAEVRIHIGNGSL